MTAIEATGVSRDPAFRCSPWTRGQHVDPIGSTPRFDAVVLVEWPLPWPRDVCEIPELTAATHQPGVRVMAVVPQSDTSAAGMTRVVHRRRTGLNHLEGTDHLVARADAAALVTALAADPGTDSSTWPSAVGASPPEVLVCAHGRRDACCGRAGTLLHVELAARWTDVRVWRCSHTGGHRFAPTAITLPDGRAWGWVDADLLHGVVDRSGDLGATARHDRGTSALGPWGQVVERALLEHFGWGWLDEPQVEADVTFSADGQQATVVLTWPEGSATGEVEIARTMPVLVCGEPPERAAKTSAEYALRSFRLG